MVRASSVLSYVLIGLLFCFITITCNTTDPIEPNSNSPNNNNADSGTTDSSPPFPANPNCPYVKASKDTELPAAFKYAQVANVDNGNGYTLVAGNENNLGYTLLNIAYDGTPISSALTFWPQAEPGGRIQLAVKDSVIAIGSRKEKIQGQTEYHSCHYGLINTQGENVLSPQLFSDLPTSSDVLVTVDQCMIAPYAKGFMALWWQATINKTNNTAQLNLLAQTISLDGKTIGPRQIITPGKTSNGFSVKLYPIWTGQKLMILHTGESLGSSYWTTIDEQGTPHTAAANSLYLHDNYLAFKWTGREIIGFSLDNFIIIDSQGVPVGSPHSFNHYSNAFGLNKYAAHRLEGNLISAHLFGLSRSNYMGDTFLAAARISDEQYAIGSSNQLINHRYTGDVTMAGSLDGQKAGLFYNRDKVTHFLALACSTEPPKTIGAVPCPVNAALPPPVEACTSANCQTVIRLDYLTLALKGYTAISGTDNAITQEAAQQKAHNLINQKIPGTSLDQVKLVVNEAGVYLWEKVPGDLGGFVMVSAWNGQILAAGSITWAGEGAFWQPALGDWKSANDLACTSYEQKAYSEPYLDKNICTDKITTSTYQALDALKVVQQLNLATNFHMGTDVKAFVYTYTPAVGVCDPTKAEFLVVLSIKK